MDEISMNEYQELSTRTMNKNLAKEETLRHSLFGLCAEVGEIHSIYQKVYQGHKISTDELKKEIGDVLWMLAELCTINGWWMGDIAHMNIEKLKKRYPYGFEEDKSVNRE